MRNFRDAKGRLWNIELNLGTAKQIKKDTQFDILRHDKERPDAIPILDLVGDTELMGNVLWSLVKDQATAAGITEEDFAVSMAGDCLDEAVDALVGTYTDFSPNPKRREILRRLWEKGRALEADSLDVGAQAVESVMPSTSGV